MIGGSGFIGKDRIYMNEVRKLFLLAHRNEMQVKIGSEVMLSEVKFSEERRSEVKRSHSVISDSLRPCGL